MKESHANMKIADSTKCLHRAFNNIFYIFKFITVIFLSVSPNLLVIAISPSNFIERPVVVTGLGKVEGSVLRSRLGTLFYAFRGIRYATPPIGDLRFKAPQPIEQWSGVFDATDDGPMCPQPTDDEISEDCLRLNVYTQSIPETITRNTPKKPVIVYIHPGGFYKVSGQSRNFAGPQNLMDQDIVLVTMNYRLGTLGFLSTGTKDYPGNAGLKDQVMALKWVKLHIANFGGDPNSVTIMGYSAGGMSVTLHMVSPMSKGLFNRAIVMSGSATAQWDIANHQLDLAQRQARVFNCPDHSLDDIMECFKYKTDRDFGNSLREMFEFGQRNPIILWKPVIEKDHGQERFLTENPTKLFRQGRFHRVPVMAGITKYEFAGPAVAVIHDQNTRFQMDTNFSKIAPICFLYERDTERSLNISTRLRKEFLNAPILDDRALPGLNDLFADGVIGFGMHRFVRLVAPYVRVYYYRNSYVGRFSHLYYPESKPYGTVHHDDLLYLFVAPSVAPMFTLTDPENTQVERMTRMWTNFRMSKVVEGLNVFKLFFIEFFGDKTLSDPNKQTDEVLKDIRWRPMTVGRMNFLDIGNNEIEMKEKLYVDRYDVWTTLFPLPSRRRSKDVNSTATFYDEDDDV